MESDEAGCRKAAVGVATSAAHTSNIVWWGAMSRGSPAADGFVTGSCFVSSAMPGLSPCRP